MASLYIASTERFSGKSALCVGLSRHFRNGGLRIGYMKPVSTGARLTSGSIDEDAFFCQQAFGLPDALEDMVPIRLNESEVARALDRTDREAYAAQLQAAYARIAAERDVVVLEGGGNLREGALVGLAAREVARLLGARALVVVKYESDLQVLDDALMGREYIPESFVAVVLNSVPRHRMPFVQEQVRPVLEARGVPVFAVLPQERLLQSVSVGELAEHLSGEFLCGEEHRDELVEHLMVGAMGVDSALSYFRRKPNKAVITGGDRSDIQLAALETSIKCLILTGGLRPSPIIQHRAEEVGVPIILVRQDTMAAVETIERGLSGSRFQQFRKVERFEEMLADRFEFGRLYAALDLRPSGP